MEKSRINKKYVLVKFRFSEYILLLLLREIQIMANYAEEGVTVTCNGRCATVKIKNFQNKMKTWQPGRYTKSETLSVDGVPLSEDISKWQ